jgi:elongation factor 1-alpha
LSIKTSYSQHRRPWFPKFFVQIDARKFFHFNSLAKSAMSSKAEKAHVSIVVCGHVDAGKSTTTGHLIFELGGIPEREMTKLREEAKTLGKESFAFAFYTDNTKEERNRGLTINPTTKEFFTNRYHYSIVDAPGHRDFIKNMISGASQADVGLLLVPADGNFTTSIQKGNVKNGEIQGQTRQHARLLNLLGIRQLIVAVNKMDFHADTEATGYREARFLEISAEMQNMLVKVGWKEPFVKRCVPILPISGWHGDNLLTKSDKMPWWKGVDVSVRPKDPPIHIDTLIDALDKLVSLPDRDNSKPLRVPVSGVYKIKGVGDVITGRVEQGTVRPKDVLQFLPTNITATVFSIEMHHRMCDKASSGDNVGMCMKGLPDKKPKVGDVMIKVPDSSLQACRAFTAQVQILDHPGELKIGYSPVVCVRTGRSACKIVRIVWKIGKDTAGAKLENPPHLVANDMAEVVFEPLGPFVCEAFDKCEGFARIAVLEGPSAVMLGKVVDVDFKSP